MKLIPDRTGRFPERPHYEVEELEEECERIINSFLEQRYGQMIIPVPTDALGVLIEREAAKLLRADLSDEGEEVHGITEFFPGRKPLVSIARELSSQPWRAHRERTTLTHEYGHVHWHTPLYDRYCRPGERHKCARGQLLPRVGPTDWMEWQAGYVSGGLLMPRSRVRLLVEAFRREPSLRVALAAGSVDGQILVGRVSEIFDVSREAAEIRLLQLGHLIG
jgi:IrrE N-terminal-like domain